MALGHWGVVPRETGGAISGGVGASSQGESEVDLRRGMEPVLPETGGAISGGNRSPGHTGENAFSNSALALDWLIFEAGEQALKGRVAIRAETGAIGEG